MVIHWIYSPSRTLKIVLNALSSMHCPQWDSFSTKIFVLWCPSRVHPQMAVILTIYRPLEDILSAHTFDEMMYADDTQLYIFNA